MLSFGDKYQLSLGEPITRELLHEAIAADVSLGSRCVHRHFMLLPDVASEDTPRAAVYRRDRMLSYLNYGFWDRQQYLRVVYEAQANYRTTSLQILGAPKELPIRVGAEEL